MQATGQAWMPPLHSTSSHSRRWAHWQQRSGPCVQGTDRPCCACDGSRAVRGMCRHTSVRSRSSLGRVARALKLKKRAWLAASRRSSPLVIPSLHSIVTCAQVPSSLRCLLPDNAAMQWKHRRPALCKRGCTWPRGLWWQIWEVLRQLCMHHSHKG